MTVQSAEHRSPDTSATTAPGGAVNRDDFLAAMAQAATGVTVVATGSGAQRWGVTVSAMSSVSADPPLVLVCIHGKSPVCAAIERNRAFCVSLLNESQRQVSDVFAGRVRTETGDRFACGAWQSRRSGSPALVGAAAHFDCLLEACHAHGTHRVFIGRVVESKAGRGAPLLYCDRNYGRLAADPAIAA